MNEMRFIQRRESEWTWLEARLEARPRRRFNSVHDACRFPLAYRRVCRDLELARHHGMSGVLVQRLNSLASRSHHVLYASRGQTTGALLADRISAFPRAVRKEIRLVAVCLAIFWGLALVGSLWVLQDPSRADLVMGEGGADALRKMYDPEAEHFLRPRGVSGDADMFGYYIMNNIGIGFRSFSLGILAGVGSLFILGFNGLFLGAASGVAIQSGLSGTFFPFVSGHGAFELTGLILYAAAGCRLGWALVSPGPHRRGRALFLAGESAFPILAGSTVFLFIAACIEAFWSSRVMAGELKLAVAAFLWAVVGVWLVLGGRRREGP